MDDVLNERCAAALAVISERMRVYAVAPTLRVIADGIGITPGDSIIVIMRELIRRGYVVRVKPEGQRPAYVPVWALVKIQEDKQ
jgi:hypothetical protein